MSAKGGRRRLGARTAPVDQADNYVNLASPQRTQHILYGDATGGGVSVLAPEPYGWFMGYLDAGEYGLAVEVASEEMPDEDPSPAARKLACGLLREAELMGLPDEVTRRLLP